MGTLMKDGLLTVLFGMGMVYVFLVVMIFLMNGMSKLLAPLKGMLEKPAAPVKAKKAAKGGLSEADQLLAHAAIAAVRMHRGEAK